MLTLLSYLQGSCWLFISFGEDIANDLCLLNIERKSKRDSTQVNQKQHFCDIVKTFSDVQELSVVNLMQRLAIQSVKS